MSLVSQLSKCLAKSCRLRNDDIDVSLVGLNTVMTQFAPRGCKQKRQLKVPKKHSSRGGRRDSSSLSGHATT